MSSFTGWTRLLARYTVAENQYICLVAWQTGLFRTVWWVSNQSACLSTCTCTNQSACLSTCTCANQSPCRPAYTWTSQSTWLPVFRARHAYVQYSVCMLFFASKNKFSKLRFPCNSYYFSTKRGESLYYESKKVSGSRSFRQCLYILRMVYGDWQYISYSSQKF